jgi:hypothetical protein
MKIKLLNRFLGIILILLILIIGDLGFVEPNNPRPYRNGHLATGDLSALSDGQSAAILGGERLLLSEPHPAANFPLVIR